MFGSAILEVAIGLIFIYVLVALICSGIREGIESWLKTRAAYLERGIRELLHDKDGSGLARSFFEHPLVFSLFTDAKYRPPKRSDHPKMFARGRGLPSYIPARNFALALLDIAARGPRVDAYSSHPDSPVISIQSVRENLLNIHDERVRRALLTALDTAQDDLDRAIENIEAWFDSGMDRVSGWYKRTTQRILFIIAIVVAVSLNVNTIAVVDYLYRDDAARAVLVARAEAAAADTTFLRETDYARARAALDSLNLPIGWGNGLGTTTADVTGWDKAWFKYFSPGLGWLLTALAATLGAPFWFDVLNKVMVIRSTVKPTEKSPEEGSEDRKGGGKGRRGTRGGTWSGGGTRPSAPASEPPDTPGDPGSRASALSAPDLESDLDGCSVDMDDATPDEDLPEARGGVALK